MKSDIPVSLTGCKTDTAACMDILKDKGLTNILLAFFTRNEEDIIIEDIELAHIILKERVIDQNSILRSI